MKALASFNKVRKKPVNDMIITSNLQSNLLVRKREELIPGFPVCLRHKIPGFVQVKKVILQVMVWTILPPKGRHQRRSKFAGVHNLEKHFSI